MQSKPGRYLLISFTILILLAGAFSSGLMVGWAAPLKKNAPALTATQTSVVTPGPTKEASEIEKLFKPFWETWDLIHNKFYDQSSVDDELLMRGAIRGMLQSLNDPHTSYMDPKQYDQSMTSLSGEYEGIGAYADTTGTYLQIISTIPGSPADKAGIKAGDKIVAVDDEDMTGMDGSLVLQRVLGPAGSKVKLTITRGEPVEKFVFEIVRAKIKIASVEGKMLDPTTAYIRLTTFGEKTGTDLHTILKDLMAKKPTGLILDLRRNGGGYLDTAVKVISEFVEGGKVAIIEQMGDGSQIPYRTVPGGLATKVPIVVLVDVGTASASEITAGALRDYERAKIVGVTTYGKGSVQTWEELANNEGAVRVTIARWLTPNGYSIHKTGLKPDFEVKLTDEDITANRDPQLDKAIEVIKSK